MTNRLISKENFTWVRKHVKTKSWNSDKKNRRYPSTPHLFGGAHRRSNVDDFSCAFFKKKVSLLRAPSQPAACKKVGQRLAHSGTIVAPSFLPARGKAERSVVPDKHCTPLSTSPEIYTSAKGICTSRRSGFSKAASISLAHTALSGNSQRTNTVLRQPEYKGEKAFPRTRALGYVRGIRRMSNLRAVVAGHVDHGKSTIIGTLLYDAGPLPQQVAEKFDRASGSHNAAAFASITDQLSEEQQGSFALDTTPAHFHTAQRDRTPSDPSSLTTALQARVIDPISLETIETGAIRLNPSFCEPPRLLRHTAGTSRWLRMRVISRVPPRQPAFHTRF